MVISQVLRKLFNILFIQKAERKSGVFESERSRIQAVTRKNPTVQQVKTDRNQQCLKQIDSVTEKLSLGINCGCVSASQVVAA